MQSMMTKIFENNMKWFNVECERPCSAHLGGFVFWGWETAWSGQC